MKNLPLIKKLGGSVRKMGFYAAILKISVTTIFYGRPGIFLIKFWSLLSLIRTKIFGKENNLSHPNK